MIINYALLILASYLIGAIPCGYLVGRAQGIDVRKYGSGRTGATNTLRTLGTRSSAIVFAGDMAKGVLVVFLARYLFQSAGAEVVAALSAMVGHNWSIYIGFFGGRGITISFGSLLAMAPSLAIVGIAVFAAVIALTRYVSLGSILGSSSMPFVIFVFFWFGVVPLEYFIYSLVGVPLLIFAHRDNIERLRVGRERKLGEKVEFNEGLHD